MGILSRPTNTKIEGHKQMRRLWRWPGMTDFYLTLIASNVVLLIVSFVLAGLVLV